jgi:nitric oxide reductase NorQ protein
MEQNALIVPEKKDFYISSTTRDKLSALVMMSQVRPQNCLLTGAPGCGKSELPAQVAASLQRRFAKFEIGLLSEAGQLLGEYQLKEGNTEYQTFLFLEAIQTPEAIVLLDEFNREESPKAKNALFPILDDYRRLYLDATGKTIEVAEGVIFFATVNEGAEFTGTDLLDTALRDRFTYIEMGLLPPDKEQELIEKRTGLKKEQSNELQGILNGVRNNNVKVSTRKAIQIGEYVNVGLGVKEAFEFCLGADKDMLEKVLLNIHLSRDDEMESSGVEEWVTL